MSKPASIQLVILVLLLFCLLGTQCHVPHSGIIKHPEVKLLTPDLGLYEHPSWSPDGAHLVFSNAPGPGGLPPEIYIMDAQGENRIRLTDNSADDQEPTWSPTGDRIAFVSNRDGTYAIYTMNPDGSDVVRLVEGYEPAWSPDGEKIAFWVRDEGAAEIFVWEQGQVTRLTNNNHDDYDPTWSPDGQQIIFSSTRQDTNGDGSINYRDAAHLYIMNADGSGQRPLTEGLDGYDEPAWSPDGRWIVFKRVPYTGSGRLETVELLDLHTGQMRVLLDESLCRDFAWSPDGKQLAFAVFGGGLNFIIEIYVMDVAEVLGTAFP